YSEGLKQQAGSFAAIQNPHPNGYKVDNLEEKDGKLEGSAVLLSVSTGKPYFSLDENKYTIIKEKNKYVIDKIEKSKNTEVMEKNRTLFKKEGGDIKGKEIIKLDDLPAFAVPQGATPDQKFSVGRDAFGPVAGDAEGKMLAISTKGNHPAIIVYDGKQKKAKSIDLFFNNTIDSLSWSEKGKYLSAEVTNPGGTKSVFIYDPENEKKIDDPMKNAMKPGKYTIINSYWISDDELVFTVQLKSTLPANEQNMAGTYKFDVKNLSITRS
ncbi:MAG TPA: hypothetical protein DD426_01560, partial [Clostridiaceae bacterium]|nr:hypothetical protein [Clostridiaceae bacterium]